jgi:hypothetical protein
LPRAINHHIGAHRSADAAAIPVGNSNESPSRVKEKLLQRPGRAASPSRYDLVDYASSFSVTTNFKVNPRKHFAWILETATFVELSHGPTQTPSAQLRRAMAILTP